MLTIAVCGRGGIVCGAPGATRYYLQNYVLKFNIKDAGIDLSELSAAGRHNMDVFIKVLR